MARYHVMDEEQRAMANEAVKIIEEAVKDQHPMAAFEAFATLLAIYTAKLGLDLGSAVARVEDRYHFFTETLLPTLKAVMQEKLANQEEGLSAGELTDALRKKLEAQLKDQDLETPPEHELTDSEVN